MTSLESIFGELGISHYLGVFIDQGFDTWETILDITESDLDALGVKLGHRRKLQRRIANYRGIAPGTSLVSPTRTSIEDARNDSNRPDTGRSDGKDGTTIAKRKYRRHPKPDENAPERPPSAYVLFSNKMREDLKGQNLTFTEIAKLVGENWQNLNRAEKEPYERQANDAKERYNFDLNEYKKTASFKKYNSYLQDFRKRQALHNQEKDAAKRLKTDFDSPRGSSTSAGPGGTTSSNGSGSPKQLGSEPPPTRQQRFDSITSLPSGVLHSEDSITSPRTYSLDEPAHGRRRGMSHSHSRDSSIQSSTFRAGLVDGQRSGESVVPPTSWLDPRGAPLGITQSPAEGSMFGLPTGSNSLMSRSTRGSISSDAAPSRRGPPSLRAGESSTGSMSSISSVQPPRTPSDASLPIHALLSSKPESVTPYATSPSPSTISLSGPPLPTTLPSQTSPHLNGLNGHSPYGNGYGSASLVKHPDHTELPYNLSRPASLSKSHYIGLSNGEHGLDGISALLKAREIVDQQRP